MFKRHGLAKVEPMGEKFNPNHHEALFEQVNLILLSNYLHFSLIINYYYSQLKVKNQGRLLQ